MMQNMKPLNRRSTPAPVRIRGNTLIGLFVGLVIGVLGAAGVVWYIHRTPPPFSNKSPAAQAAVPAGAPAASGAATTPMALPGKPGDPVPQNSDKPRFDFYKILPGSADAVPDTRPKDEKPTESRNKAEKEGLLKDPVYLQAGSFQNAADADNQKARLAMMGAEATVQQVMLQEKVWYRVRLGPYRKMDEITSLRAELARQGIDANVVKKD